MTLFGIVTDVKLKHSSKADVPIEVTLFGIVTDVKLTHLLKAQSPIEVTVNVFPALILAGITTSPV